MTRPITILHAGSVAFIDGGIVLVGWSVDTGGRGEVKGCIGEILIAARDHINKCFDDTMKAVPEETFDQERIAAAKAACEDIWRKI